MRVSTVTYFSDCNKDIFQMLIVIAFSCRGITSSNVSELGRYEILSFLQLYFALYYNTQKMLSNLLERLMCKSES